MWTDLIHDFHELDQQDRLRPARCVSVQRSPPGGRTPEVSALCPRVADSGFCPGSCVSESSPPSSLSLSEHKSPAKSEPSLAPSPFAGHALASASQVHVPQTGQIRPAVPLFSYMLLSCLQTASQLDSVGQVDIKYEDYPFTSTSMGSRHSWCALSQA